MTLISYGHNFKAYSVLPFSYLLWKMIEQSTNKLIIDLKDYNFNLLALMSFTILPSTYDTLLHKLVKRSTDALLYLLESSKKPSWPES
jgi:hypothetical protein